MLYFCIQVRYNTIYEKYVAVQGVAVEVLDSTLHFVDSELLEDTPKYKGKLVAHLLDTVLKFVQFLK